jgi:hypothetical protein
MCIGVSPRDIWADQMAAVLDMYYGDRWSWRHPDACLIIAAIHADPAYLGPDNVRKLVRELESRRRFDLDRWLSELGLTTAAKESSEVDIDVETGVAGAGVRQRERIPRYLPDGTRGLATTEQDRAKLRWRANIWRAVAWLRAPSDEEDHASFQLDVMWLDGPERLPEVYVLDLSNPGFEVAWSLLRTALASLSEDSSGARGLSVQIYPVGPGPFGEVRPDGTVLVRNLSVKVPPYASSEARGLHMGTRATLDARVTATCCHPRTAGSGRYSSCCWTR